ncbi:hypothetical protein KQX54_007159 [Cotesia glomerata]|uniref:Caspase family p20 domain-containing protein n=1 Tax=Cotesia glomerata TaxID=32391 RepID=A0AAV7IXI5_COTGL|nr:hypothetical protein KQX54_007159 [Cotesia glomerata]
MLIVMSHGAGKNMVHAYDAAYHIFRLWSPFIPDKCPTLAGKPKNFCFQVCRAAEEDHSQHDCLMVIAMSHGEAKSLVIARDAAYRINRLWSLFTPDKCPSLAGKPKIFILQTCRGDINDEEILINSKIQSDGGYNESYRILGQADFLFAYAAPQGNNRVRSDDNISLNPEAIYLYSTDHWEVEKTINNLKDKAGGSDGITPKY